GLGPVGGRGDDRDTRTSGVVRPPPGEAPRRPLLPLLPPRRVPARPLHGDARSGSASSHPVGAREGEGGPPSVELHRPAGGAEARGADPPSAPVSRRGSHRRRRRSGRSRPAAGAAGEAG